MVIKNLRLLGKTKELKMKNKLEVVLIVLMVILVGMSFVVNNALATNQPPCCEQVDEPEEVSVPSHSSSSRSGSYVKKPLAPYTILKLGDRGDAVKQFQMVLNEFGKANLKVDGKLGILTWNAWLNYQLSLK